MTKLIAAEGHIMFKTLIRESMIAAGYEFKRKDPKAVLVWYDNLRKIDYFGQQKPWQIVNRFPMMNIICRKAPFVRLLQRTAQTFPSQFKFLPKSFLVPLQQREFEGEYRSKQQKWIIKPDRGSLGAGIKVVDIGEPLPKIDKLCVAQAYIPSFLIDQYKFDFRIFALVASVDPLKIYVYRNGVARFCSKKSTEKSVFSELTNKSLNKKNPDVVMTQIVKMIADVMDRLSREGHDIQRLWQRIDRAIVATIITASKFLKSNMEKQCPRIGFQRCFQILGFDVLLDQELNPYILEVNYRPSLETNADYEKKMKKAMLSDAMSIMAPSIELQNYVNEHYSEELADNWEYLMHNDPELKRAIELTNHKTVTNLGLYVQAYPTDNERQQKKWDRMIEFVAKMPSELKTKYMLPQALKKKPLTPATAFSSATEIEDSERLELIKNIQKNQKLSNPHPISIPIEPIESSPIRLSKASSRRISKRSSSRASRMSSVPQSEKNSVGETPPLLNPPPEPLPIEPTSQRSEPKNIEPLPQSIPSPRHSMCLDHTPKRKLRRRPRKSMQISPKSPKL